MQRKGHDSTARERTQKLPRSMTHEDPVSWSPTPSPEVSHHWFQLLIITAICDGTTNRDEVSLIDKIARETGMEVTWNLEESRAPSTSPRHALAQSASQMSRNLYKLAQRQRRRLQEIRSSMFRVTLVDGELAPREQELWDMMDRVWKA